MGFYFFKTSEDDPGEVQCVGIDITARVQAENEIKFQANLLDKIRQAVVAVDRERIFNYWKKAATTIYGWSAEEMIGRNVSKHASSGNFDVASEIHTVQSYLHSILYNLINNSVKYRHPERQPKIYIRSERKKDNLLGMDLSKKEDQVFELYKRFHHHIEGKEMGLFMVKTQVELLGGKISVKSEVGKGTEFIVELKQYGEQRN